MFLLLLAPARATPVLVEDQSAGTIFNPPPSIIHCPAGKRAIFAGGTWFGASEHPFLDVLRTTPAGAEAGWHFTDGAGYLTNAEVQATCIDAGAAACIHLESASTAIDLSLQKEVELVCPHGSFALGADFKVTGETDGVEVYTHAPQGLLAPVGWTIGASVREGTPSWGLSGSLRCVSPDVYAYVTAHPLEVDVATLPDGAWVGSAKASIPIDDPLDKFPLGMGMRLSPGPPGGLVTLTSDGIGWVHDDLEVGASYYIGQLPEGSLPSLQDAALLYTAEPDAFEEGLGSCSVPVTPPRVVDRFSVGGTVWYGLAGGGSGVIFLPGQGPVPVDPEPFHQAFAALPVGVASYPDPAERDARVREIGAGLTAERTPWSIVDTAEATLRGSGVVMVVPRDEVAAVQWLSAHRAELGALAHTTLVFLQQGGPAQAQLAQW